ncbi:MAG: enoyl-CoA hydratase/isomerase family protein [Gammaproteobacteria bacterium]
MSAVEVEKLEPGITLVTLNRPERLNAINGDLIAGVYSALAGVRADPECRVVILTGAGRGFCAGADLKAGTPEMPGSGTQSELGKLWDAQEYLTGMASAINSLRQPVIAAVNGVAVGGGLGLALASDLRVASDQASFGAKFIKIGLSNLDVGVSYFLPRIVGAGRALELMLTAKIIGAAEAERIGLVNRVVPHDDLIPAALEMAREIASNSAWGVWMTKEGVWTNIDAPSLHHAVMLEYRTQATGAFASDMKEAIEAFNQKRPPRWSPL